MKKRELQYEKTHHAILDATRDLIWEKSVEETTIREICRRCDITVGAFYHHFSSKEEVLSELFRFFDEQIEHADHLDQSFDSPEDEILFFMECALVQVQNIGLHWVTQLFRYLMSLPTSDIWDRGRSFYQAVWICCKEIAEKSGLELDPQEMADELLRAFRGSVYCWCLAKGEYHLVDTTLTTVHRLLDAYHKSRATEDSH